MTLTADIRVSGDPGSLAWPQDDPAGSVTPEGTIESGQVRHDPWDG